MKILILVLVASCLACSMLAELETGSYVCTAQAAGFENLPPYRFTSEDDVRLEVRPGGTGFSFLDEDDGRITLLPGDAAGWWCEKETT